MTAKQPPHSTAGPTHDSDGARPAMRKKSAAARAKKRTSPKKVTPTYLENAALYYLERFASSKENLRRVLERKVIRSAHAHGTDPQEGHAWIDDLLKRFERSGLLDDAAYAAMRATSLRRQGNSSRAIYNKLLQKGVAADTIERALNDVDEQNDSPNSELAAAVRLAKKRRFGPWRENADARSERRERDLAALARAGFSYDIAIRVIDAPNTHSLEDEAK